MDNALTFTSTPDILVADTAVAEMPTVAPAPTPAQAKTRPAAKIWRFLVHKWDMLAVVAFMIACGIYGIYALTQMTGF